MGIFPSRDQTVYMTCNTSNDHFLTFVAPNNQIYLASHKEKYQQT